MPGEGDFISGPSQNDNREAHNFRKLELPIKKKQNKSQAFHDGYAQLNT